MINQLINASAIRLLILALLIGGCQPSQDNPSPSAVPDALLLSPTPDSVITLTEQVDFAVLSETGKGPTGSLIRAELFNPGGPNYLRTFTYDDRGRLIGALYPPTNRRLAEIIHYQGDYLAEQFVGEYQNSSTVRVTIWRKYKCTPDKQLKQMLFYSRYADDIPFRLLASVTYEYNADGQLRLMRSSYSPKGSYSIRYIENGNYVRVEDYVSAGPDNPKPRLTQAIYTYDRQATPEAGMSLYGTESYLPSAHYETGFTAYAPKADGSFEKLFEQYQETGYQYDAQGRVISTRVRRVPDGFWSNWGLTTFTYAP
ncbi:hypothetical protein [Spirosoma koreense]